MDQAEGRTEAKDVRLRVGRGVGDVGESGYFLRRFYHLCAFIEDLFRVL